MFYYNILKLLLILIFTFSVSPKAAKLAIGSKSFTENIILGEMISQHLSYHGIEAEHKKALGGSQILWKALLTGEIDAYPEYSGTLEKELLNHATPQEVDNRLKALGLTRTKTIGFNNTYALGMKKSRAKALNITSISDLRNHSDLIFGFYNEFIDREDGWPGIKRTYQLTHANVLGMEHALSYKALKNSKVDVIDLYSTDAEIAYYDLLALKDDKSFFPEYYAMLLYRADLVDRFPEAQPLISQFEHSIQEDQMIKLNHKAQIHRIPETEVARRFLNDQFGNNAKKETISQIENLWLYTHSHIWLVFASLIPAILIAIPLGIAAAHINYLAAPILGIVSIMQTLPALALLMFMIPFFGIGSTPAIAALFLYSLLPITRNTYVGIKSVANNLQESACALGLPKLSILQKIELPIALPTIIAGIKTAAVINVGTATLGAFIGAGGLGEPILTGLRLDDHRLIILLGALPAALLALGTLGVFSLIERKIVPRGLKLSVKH